MSARVALSINFNSLQRVHPLSLGDVAVDDDAFFSETQIVLSFAVALCRETFFMRLYDMYVL